MIEREEIRRSRGCMGQRRSKERMFSEYVSASPTHLINKEQHIEKERGNEREGKEGVQCLVNESRGHDIGILKSRGY